MVTPTGFLDLRKPVIGMIHLAALPGSAPGEHTLTEVTRRALEEALMLSDAGFDALLLQNTGDVPAPHESSPETIAFMTHIADAIQTMTDLPLGVNVLMNGSKAALAIAAAVGASFIRIKIIVGAVVTSTGIVAADPHEVLSFRKRIGAQQITILADLYDRTSAPLADMPIDVMADLAVRHGGADALVITGYSVKDTMERLRMVRSTLPGVPLYVGGGVNAGNVGEFMTLSDGMMVGSAYKTSHHFLDPVDPEKAATFMRVASDARQHLDD